MTEREGSIEIGRLTLQEADRNFVKIGSAQELRAKSARHHITLRHRALANRYHSLLLFSFPKPHEAVGGFEDNNLDEPGPSRLPSLQFYCMEAVCPHLGAPLEHASIYDNVDEDDIEDAVVVCPWHEMDFSLRSGESSSGLKACVYAVEERAGQVYVQEPSLEPDEDGKEAGWQVIEVRPVSEEATNGRQTAANALHSASQNNEAVRANVKEVLIPDPSPLPTTLVEWAVVILNTPEPRSKVELTRRAAKAFRSGQCRIIGGGRWSGEDEERNWLVRSTESPPDVPPRLASAQVVQPGREARRGKGGSERSRIAMLHSLANIEQWAIDLAWDIIARATKLYAHRQARSTSSRHSKLPVQFFSDFVKVAEDEAKHFTLLQNRLVEMGAQFGDLPVHHGLWDSAAETKHDLAARLSIIHLVHEARGLDANPLTIKKFDNANDKESVKILTTIHLDEVTHVSAGHRWLTYICDSSVPKESPVEVFRSAVKQHFAGKLKGPFNDADRQQAGLSREWYEDLKGEKMGAYGVQRAEVPGG